LTIHFEWRRFNSVITQNTNGDTMRSALSFSRISATAALLIFAGWASLPAAAQGLVPPSSGSAPKVAPGAAEKGIKDSKIKTCGNCGLTGGRVKREGGKVQPNKAQQR
jgi:hypothetical protein